MTRLYLATASGGGSSDCWDVPQEQQAGTPSADLTLGPGVDARFARNGATFLTDALGSTTALASAGALQTSYGYDPCGVAQVSGTASDNPFQYTGRENDGTSLLHYRNRYYSPAWARFVSEDPIGLSGGDVNLYRYVANNPEQGRDPSGNNPRVGKMIGDAIVAVTRMILACQAAGGAAARHRLPRQRRPRRIRPNRRPRRTIRRIQRVSPKSRLVRRPLRQRTLLHSQTILLKVAAGAVKRLRISLGRQTVQFPVSWETGLS
jgi:RHS repeat-associated protein